MPSTEITPVTVFVDWNSQIHAARPGSKESELGLAHITLRYVGCMIGRALYSMAPTGRFDVTLRLYHGWHKGFEITSRRKALIQIISGADFTVLSNRSNVIIRQSVQFGDLLISALQHRLHSKINCHLPNTLRNSIQNPRKTEEKMVDTAIASDVVDLAHREPLRWLVVMGDDDDLVPPMFVAEGIRGTRGGKILLIRTRPPTPFLNLQEIRYTP